MNPPETRYAQSGDPHTDHQVDTGVPGESRLFAVTTP